MSKINDEVALIKRGEVVPISRLHILRDELRLALDGSKWKTVRNRARCITAIIPYAMNPSTCMTGTPHLDGVYSIGTQNFYDAPDKTKEALNDMNSLIGKCRDKLRTKKKKKKKR